MGATGTSTHYPKATYLSPKCTRVPKSVNANQNKQEHIVFFVTILGSS